MAIRVDIRPYERGDADALYAAVRESITEVSPWMPWCHPAYSLEDARGWIEATLTGRSEGTMFDFAMIADGRFAGGCGINQINRQDRVANLGYWVRTSCAGQDITPRAVRLLLDWAFANTELNRIEIVAAVDNVPSQRVAEKVGAHRDAVLHKRTMTAAGPSAAVLYSVVRAD
jgi:ribosomal-protein-serine acetyltransferase